MAESETHRDWILNFETIRKETIGGWEYNVIELPLLGRDSDGDENVAIPEDHEADENPFVYRQKLADQYMAQFSQAKPDTYYLFDELPDRYIAVLRTRKRTGRVDRYFYGHPSGRAFRSPNEFWPHFWWLVGRAVRKVENYDKAKAQSAGKEYKEPEIVIPCKCKLCL